MTHKSALFALFALQISVIFVVSSVTRIAFILPVKSVGVMGDERTHENVISLRAVTSSDAMTADWAKLPDSLLRKVSNRIINEVKGANRVVYDISSKPPSTIEWE